MQIYIMRFLVDLFLIQFIVPGVSIFFMTDAAPGDSSGTQPTNLSATTL